MLNNSLPNTSRNLDGSSFHHRKSSLTALFPPSDKRVDYHKKRNSASQFLTATTATATTTARSTASNSSIPKLWIKRIFNMPVVKLIGYIYLFLCFSISTIHLVRLFFLLDSSSDSTGLGPKIDWDQIIMEKQQQLSPQSYLDDILPETRLSKMYSKSGVNNDFIRPYWFSASIKHSKDALTLTTVLTMSELDSLTSLANRYEGPISATILVPSTTNINHHLMIQQLTHIRTHYETTASLRRHVDIHLLLQPGGLTDEGIIIATGGYQESRNLARLFSRTDYVAHVPVATLWITSSLARSVRQHHDQLNAGDLLIVPTFGFPDYQNVNVDTWPTDKQTLVEWVESGEMGLLDYNYELNNGPTSYSTWKDAKEAYKVPNYDYKYGPIYVSTRLDQPWCEERFEDHLPSCIYGAYLAGANLWVLPNDYAVRTGQEPVDTLDTAQRIRMQNKISERYRMERCVFYARQFDQYDTFNSEKAMHVKQECSKALLSLQKQKMISANVFSQKPSRQK